MFHALFFHAAGLWRLPFSQLLLTVYIWLIHSKPSRLNLISLSAPCVEPSMISPDVSPLVTPSAFRRNVSESTPGFSQDCTMENVQPSFSTFQSSRISLGAHSLLKGYLWTACPESITLRVSLCGKDCILRLSGVCRSLIRFRVLLHPDFIFRCSSNPPAISLSLLCWRIQVITPPPPPAGTHFQAIWPLVWAYLTVWETKRMSHFHCSLSLWCCEFVTACHLPSPQPPRTG